MGAAVRKGGRAFSFPGGWGFHQEADLPTKIRTARQLAVACARVADDKKATAIAILDVGPVLQLTDYFVIATCSNPRQSRAIAEELVRTFKHQGIRCLGEEGKRDSTWILLDFGDVVVHLLETAQREFYDLEGLWADAKRVTWNGRTRKPREGAGD